MSRSPVTIVVSRPRASASTVSVTYATANQTATAGSDYVAAGGSVTFPAGSTSQARWLGHVQLSTAWGPPFGPT